MFGLIEATGYTAAKQALIAADPATEAAIDAIEWELEHTSNFSEFQIVAPASTDGFAVYAHQIAGRAVVVFTFEIFGRDRKILLLDAWVAAIEA